MEMVKTGEFEAKIIGEGKNKKFFDSLAGALKAFLMEEISQLTILGGGVLCSFSSRRATVRRQNQGEFDEFFVQAPIVPLLFCRNIGQEPIFTLDVEFEEFFIKMNQGIQIYEQRCHNPESKGLQGFTNYMINFDWDERDPERILLHLHNCEVIGDGFKGFWRADFHYYKNRDGNFDLSPIFDSLHEFVDRFSKN